MNSSVGSSSAPDLETVELTASDIEGAHLDEPVDKHTVVSLRWWLLCHGIKASTSWKKSELVTQ